MFKLSERSNFESIRAKWDDLQNLESSSRIPRKSLPKLSTTNSLVQSAEVEKFRGRLRRLSSFTAITTPLTALRSRAFSRSRQVSKETTSLQKTDTTSSSSSSTITTTRKNDSVFDGEALIGRGLGIGQIATQSTSFSVFRTDVKPGTTELVKSQTTSFLPRFTPRNGSTKFKSIPTSGSYHRLTDGETTEPSRSKCKSTSRIPTLSSISQLKIGGNDSNLSKNRSDSSGPISLPRSSTLPLLSLGINHLSRNPQDKTTTRCNLTEQQDVEKRQVEVTGRRQLSEFCSFHSRTQEELGARVSEDFQEGLYGTVRLPTFEEALSMEREAQHVLEKRKKSISELIPGPLSTSQSYEQYLSGIQTPPTVRRIQHPSATSNGLPGGLPKNSAPGYFTADNADVGSEQRGMTGQRPGFSDLFDPFDGIQQSKDSSMLITSSSDSYETKYIVPITPYRRTNATNLLDREICKAKFQGSIRPQPEDSPTSDHTVHLGKSSMRLIRQVHSPQSTAYWSGRFSSLLDRSLNESFDTTQRPICSSDLVPSRYSYGTTSTTSGPSEPSDPPAISQPKFQPSLICKGVVVPNTGMTNADMDAAQRAARIFQLLEAACITDEALRSLKVFQDLFARKEGFQWLECEIPVQIETAKSFNTPSLASTISEQLNDDKDFGSSFSVGSGQGPSFMERLVVRRWA